MAERNILLCPLNLFYVLLKLQAHVGKVFLFKKHKVKEALTVQ